MNAQRIAQKGKPVGELAL